MAKDMTEAEAKKIYDLRHALWKVFGGDLRERCRAEGVSDEMITKFIREDAAFDRFLDIEFEKLSGK